MYPNNIKARVSNFHLYYHYKVLMTIQSSLYSPIICYSLHHRACLPDLLLLGVDQSLQPQQLEDPAEDGVMGLPPRRGGRVLASVPQVVGEVEEGEQDAVPLPGRLPGNPGVVVGGCEMLARRGRSSPVPRVITTTKPARKQRMFSMIWFLRRVRNEGGEDKVLRQGVGSGDVENLPPAADVGGGGE